MSNFMFRLSDRRRRRRRRQVGARLFLSLSSVRLLFACRGRARRDSDWIPVSLAQKPLGQVSARSDGFERSSAIVALKLRPPPPISSSTHLARRPNEQCKQPAWPLDSPGLPLATTIPCCFHHHRHQRPSGLPITRSRAWSCACVCVCAQAARIDEMDQKGKKLSYYLNNNDNNTTSQSIKLFIPTPRSPCWPAIMMIIIIII